nr:unnamed protein product [Callosobruchus chinensis]
MISTATIRQRVLASGLRCRRPLREPLLTARHRTARFQRARAHQDWLLPQWRNVLFSDESRFGLVSDDYRERIWRERGGQNRLATAIGLPLIVAEHKCCGVVSDLMEERNSFIFREQ